MSYISKNINRESYWSIIFTFCLSIKCCWFTVPKKINLITNKKTSLSFKSHDENEIKMILNLLTSFRLFPYYLLNYLNNFFLRNFFLFFINNIFNRETRKRIKVNKSEQIVTNHTTTTTTRNGIETLNANVMFWVLVYLSWVF